MLSARDLDKSFGGRALLAGAELYLEAGEKVGLVGNNGSGKSTLLACLAGDASFDAGTVALAGGTRVALLRQQPPETTATTLLELVLAGAAQAPMAGDATSQRVVAETLLARLGLFDAQAPLATASGGTVRRAALAAALAAEPDLLLLDEPTNHLDIETVAWLEQAIDRFRGAVLVVTHDRWLLNQVALRIVELRQGKLTSYPGTFQDYLAQRLEQDALEQRLEGRRRNLLAKELDWLGRSPAARTTRPKARLERALALRDDRPELERPLALPDLDAERLGKTVLEVRGLSAGHPGGPVVCRDLDLTMARGDRLVLVGPNGAGKTTLLRTLLGELTPLAGTVKLGVNTLPMVIDQGRTGLDPSWTLRQAAALAGGDTVEVGGQRMHVAAWLEQLLFRREDFEQKVATLSGGQRFRLLLARRLQEPANLLVFDEPTNDLDLETLAVLEAALDAWKGCVLCVSHDRAFVDRIATGLVHVDGGAVTRTAGGWAQLLAVRAEQAQRARDSDRSARERRRDATPEQAAANAAPPKLTWAEERRLAGIEAEIEAGEGALATLAAQLEDAAVLRDPQRLREVSEAVAAAEQAVAALWQEWQRLEAKASAWQASRQTT